MSQKSFHLKDQYSGIDLAVVSDYLVNRYHVEAEPSVAMSKKPLPSAQFLKMGYDLAALGVQFAQNPKSVSQEKIRESVSQMTLLALDQKARFLCLPQTRFPQLNAMFAKAAADVKADLFSDFAIVVADVPHIPLRERDYYDGLRNRKSMFSPDRRDVWTLVYPQSQPAIV